MDRMRKDSFERKWGPEIPKNILDKSSESWANLNVYLQNVNKRSNGASPEVAPAKYGPPSAPPPATKALNDMMLSYPASRKPGPNNSSGLKRLERTSSTNFNQFVSATRMSMAEFDAMGEALRLSRRPNTKWTRNKYGDTPIPLANDTGTRCYGYRKIGVAKSKAKMAQSKFCEVSGFNGRVIERKKYRNRLRGRKRKTVNGERFAVNPTPQPPTHSTLPSLRELLEAYERKVARQSQDQDYQYLDPEYAVFSPPGAIPPPKPVKHAVRRKRNVRPQWDSSYQTARPPKPVLLEPYFKSFENSGRLRTDLLPNHMAKRVPKPKVTDFSRGETRLSGGGFKNTPESWLSPPWASPGQATPNSLLKDICQEDIPIPTSYPRPTPLRESLETGQGLPPFPASNVHEKYGGAILRTYPAWASVGVGNEKFGRGVPYQPASGRSPGFQAKNESYNWPNPIYTRGGTTLKPTTYFPAREKNPERISESPPAFHPAAEDTKSQIYRKKGQPRQSSVQSSGSEDFNNRYTGVKPFPQMAANSGKSVGRPLEAVLCEDNAVPRQKATLVRRISRSTVGWISKKFSGSKTSPEERNVPLTKAQATPPELTPSRQRRKRMTAQEAIENSERIRLGLLRLEEDEDPKYERPRTGKLADRVQAITNMTASVVTVGGCDSEFDIILPPPKKMNAFTRLFSTHKIGERPRVASNESIAKKGFVGRFLDGIRNVRGRHNSRVDS